MPRRPVQSERIALPGPAGPLEVLIEAPADSAAQRFGVVCHPHPQFGGTLDNKVVYTLTRAFHELDMPTMRFNFRGVGKSAGSFAEGIGETDDALAVIAAGQERWPGAALWLAGFSFGGAVAIRAAARVHPEGLVTVAPAVTRVDVSDVAAPQGRWLIVHGDADDVVEPRSVIEWAQRLPHPPQITLLPGVGHYFHGHLHELQDAVVSFARS
jgi:alpha/beta superfamily hydrolase